jgi:hypothetical protein
MQPCAIQIEKIIPDGGRTHDLLLRRQTRFHCATGTGSEKARCIQKRREFSILTPTAC